MSNPALPSNPRARLLAEPRRLEIRAPDDLLTAGLGLDGLRGPLPGFADPARPTSAELRRRAVYLNYRGLHEIGERGGYGRLFGVRPGQRLGGVEYLVALAGPDGSGRHTAWLQIPENFDPRRPCLVAAAASGSRGVQGALPIAGAWAFAHGCALVSTDKGTGMGLFDVDSGTAIRIDGTLTDNPGDPEAGFFPDVAPRPGTGRLEPHTVLFRHAQGGNNPEREWGHYLLQAIDAALQLLAREFSREQAGHGFQPEDVRIIATGISNGGMTVLRALETDVEGWIDGAVVSEPNVLVAGLTEGLEVESEGRLVPAPGRSLFDYATEHMLLQPCAVLGGLPADAPFVAQLASMAPLLGGWSQGLGNAGILPAGTITNQAGAARQRLREAGIRSEALELGAFNLGANLWPAVAYSYSMAYGRSAPWETPLGVRFAATDTKGQARALSREELARAFTDGGGIAPTHGINALAPLVPGTPPTFANGGSVSLALAFRALADRRLPGDATWRDRVQHGLAEATMSARPGNRPIILLHGRADSLIPVNHTSRAYYAAARARGADGLHYYEVVHGQHFDGFLGLPGFDSRYVPLQPHLESALDLMLQHLRDSAALPPSQVVRSQARGIALPPLSPTHLGTIESRPADSNRVRFDGRRLKVPE